MTYLGLIAANLRRNKLRTALTAGAVTLAVVLVCILLTMPTAIDSLLTNITSNTRITVHSKAGLVYYMPHSFTRKVRQVDGVAAAMAAVWFNGSFEDDDRVTFPTWAIESDQVAAVFPDYHIPEQQLADFARYRDGALVGRPTMQRYGWKIGDRITLRSTLWPAVLDLRIVAEIPKDDTPQLCFSREYLDQALIAGGQPGLGVTGVIFARVTDAQRVNGVMEAIDALSSNSDFETATETEKSYITNFYSALQGFIALVLLVTGLVALCIVFIAANTASMGVRERAGEIGVLKAIGFSRRVIFNTLLAEAVGLSFVAGVAGVLLTVAIARSLRAFADWGVLGPLGPLGSFIITAPVIVQGVFLSLFVGMLAGVVPSFGAARKPVVETLREIF